MLPPKKTWVTRPAEVSTGINCSGETTPVNIYPAPWDAVSGANLMSALQGLGKRGHCHGFVSVEDRDLPTGSEERYSMVIDLAGIGTFSFLVINSGSWPVSAGPQLSPDGVLWGAFGDLAYPIAAGDQHLFVPQSFLRYARIEYSSVVPGNNSLITVWFQGQGP